MNNNSKIIKSAKRTLSSEIRSIKNLYDKVMSRINKIKKAL